MPKRKATPGHASPATHPEEFAKSISLQQVFDLVQCLNQREEEFMSRLDQLQTAVQYLAEQVVQVITKLNDLQQQLADQQAEEGELNNLEQQLGNLSQGLSDALQPHGQQPTNGGDQSHQGQQPPTSPASNVQQPSTSPATKQPRTSEGVTPAQAAFRLLGRGTGTSGQGQQPAK